MSIGVLSSGHLLSASTIPIWHTVFPRWLFFIDCLTPKMEARQYDPSKQWKPSTPVTQRYIQEGLYLQHVFLVAWFRFYLVKCTQVISDVGMEWVSTSRWCRQRQSLRWKGTSRKTVVSGLQHCNTSRLTIVTGWYCELQSLYTVFSTSPTARSFSGAPFPRWRPAPTVILLALSSL